MCSNAASAKTILGEIIKSAFIWEAIYILLVFIQIYDNVTSAKVISLL